MTRRPRWATPRPWPRTPAATTIDVRANDTNPDGGPKTITAVTQPANGTVVITNGGNDLTYEPDADYCNDGSPDRRLHLHPQRRLDRDGQGQRHLCERPGHRGGRQPRRWPRTPGPPRSTSRPTTLDVDGGTITGVTQPANGTVVITNGGDDLTYEPDADYCNDPPGTTTDDFTYTVTGGSTATVAVTVTCVDDAPVAVDDTATVDRGRRARPRSTCWPTTPTSTAAR